MHAPATPADTQAVPAVPRGLVGVGGNPGVRHSLRYHGAIYRAVFHPFHWLKILFVASGNMPINQEILCFNLVELDLGMGGHKGFQASQCR